MKPQGVTDRQVIVFRLHQMILYNCSAKYQPNLNIQIIWVMKAIVSELQKCDLPGHTVISSTPPPTPTLFTSVQQFQTTSSASSSAPGGISRSTSYTQASCQTPQTCSCRRNGVIITRSLVWASLCLLVTKPCENTFQPEGNVFHEFFFFCVKCIPPTLPQMLFPPKADNHW